MLILFRHEREVSIDISPYVAICTNVEDLQVCLSLPVQPRIAFGRTAKYEHFPHVARLTVMMDRTIQNHCAGSLISENYVLTAAHCVYNFVSPDAIKLANAVVVSLGPDNPQEKVVMYCQYILKHPDFTPLRHIHDIALIKLPQKITFSQYVKPIKLVSGKIPRLEFTGQSANTSGWGGTFLWKKSTDTLLYGSSKILKPKVCNIIKKEDDDHDIVCTFGLRSACVGDSGGPLEINGTLIGVTTYIVGMWVWCGFPSISFYTPVADYREWIAAYSDVEFS